MYKKSSGRAALGMFALSLSLAAHAGPSDKADLQIRKQLASATQTGWSAVIVRTDGAPTAKQEARLRALGADVYRRLTIIDSLALRIPNRNLAKLAALPFVKRLSADMEVKKTDAFTVGRSGADIAWNYGFSGTGIGVAILDSGVNQHYDLTRKGNIKESRVASVNFTTTADASDLCGHGTHIAGIVGGNGAGSSNFWNTQSFYGVAPDSNIVNVKVLDGYGRGTVSNVIAGIQWAIANRAASKIRVLNLSLGHPVGESYKTDPLCQAVESAWKANIVVVCAAGNNGRANAKQKKGQPNEGWGTAYGSIQSPGNDPLVITVGAVKNYNGIRAFDRIATYSSRGPSRIDYVLKPDLVAPGNQVISLNAPGAFLEKNYVATNVVPLREYSNLNSDYSSYFYFRLSGTSMAAPVVSGAAALMLQANPSLSPDAIKARLMASADKWGNPDGTGDALTYGAGYLNIPAALSSTVTPTKYATSPNLIVDPITQKLTLDPNSLWGAQALWGKQAIWGTQSISGTQAIWGAQAIWGTQAIWGNQALWGSQALWGNQAIWGSQAIWGNQAIWGMDTSTVDLTSTAIQGEN